MRDSSEWTPADKCLAHLSVGVSVVLLCPGLVILLYEGKVFLSLALEDQLPAPPVGRQVALREGGRGGKVTSPELEQRLRRWAMATD